VNPAYPFVAERAGWRCEYCHAPGQAFNFPFEIDHIIPRSAHGDDSPDNLALACGACNVFKRETTFGQEEGQSGRIGLYNPRLDKWTDHFQADGETGEIVVLTACGRVTISLLRMNSDFQRRSRRHWVRLGLFP